MDVRKIKRLDNWASFMTDGRSLVVTYTSIYIAIPNASKNGTPPCGMNVST